MIIDAHRNVYEFSDAKGQHAHLISTGPYDPKKPITCKSCILHIQGYRHYLTELYGWSEWPTDCSVAILGEQ